MSDKSKLSSVSLIEFICSELSFLFTHLNEVSLGAIRSRSLGRTERRAGRPANHPANCRDHSFRCRARIASQHILHSLRMFPASIEQTGSGRRTARVARQSRFVGVDGRRRRRRRRRKRRRLRRGVFCRRALNHASILRLTQVGPEPAINCAMVAANSRAPSFRDKYDCNLP